MFFNVIISIIWNVCLNKRNSGTDEIGNSNEVKKHQRPSGREVIHPRQIDLA